VAKRDISETKSSAYKQPSVLAAGLPPLKAKDSEIDSLDRLFTINGSDVAR
jgi:hypothetical protein